MKKTLLGCLFICYGISVFAQQNNNPVIQKDTINLHGIVYNSIGRPVREIIIAAKQKDLKFNRYPIYARTDSNGYFELKGIMPQDTLTIRNLDGVSLYMNKGSRYMVIYLPQDKIIDLNSKKPLMVIAKRKYPKMVPIFKITKDENYGGGYVVEKNPGFPGGIIKFYEYIQKQLTYPEKAIENNIEGTVEIAFSITRDGSLADFKIVKGLGYGCDEATIAAVKKTPKWSPGIVNSRPVTVHATVSVEFKLTD